MLTNIFTGPHHHRNSRPSNHRYIPLHRRHRLVRKCLHDNRLRFPASLRPNLHLLLPQMGVPLQRLHLRTRLPHLRRLAKLTHFYRRPCHCRSWLSRNLLWQYCAYGRYSTTAQAACLSEFHGCGILGIFGGGSSYGRSFHDASYVEMVFLHQLACWRRNIDSDVLASAVE